MRSSYTLSEIESDYSHSHLPGIHTGFGSFCTGIGPINEYLYGIQKTEEEWLFLFTLLNQYIRWQSTAGRPYRHISQMGNYGIPPRIDSYIAKQILNSKVYKIRNIKYKFSDFGIDVIPSEGMEEEVASLLEESIYKTYLCFKNPDGEYLVNSQVKLTPRMRNLKDTELFTFKGELIKIKILNERTNEQSNYKPNAPIPDLTKDLCAELSNRLTKAYIKRSRIIPKDTGESSQEHNREDEVLVLSHT
jgi:hypothetical protein